MTTRPHVMIVDDEIGALTLMGIMLERANYAVAKVRTVDGCLQLLGTRAPDILVTDTVMPGKSGIDLIRAVRQLSQHANIPILLLSTRGDAASVIEGLEAGANDYLMKPILSDELVEKVDSLLEKCYQELFPPDCALILHGDYPDVDYLAQFCRGISARIPMSVVVMPSRADAGGRSRNQIAAMRASRSLTVLVSDESIGRDYIRTGYEYFAGHDKPLTAILFDDVELPDVFNTCHIFRPSELEAYCEWLARVHRTQRRL